MEEEGNEIIDAKHKSKKVGKYLRDWPPKTFK